MATNEKAEKTRVEAERRSAVKVTAKQKYEKARVDAERRSVVKLSVEQKSK